ncbi:MAG: hypothetical protein K0Q77_49 [Anaerosporomusa subterranea]|nr:hypothetical protein [Anaerosporomusa subterranea]MDF2572308.1 hypothetical protein [Sporomusa sp.]
MANYKLNVLIEAVNEYFYAEQELKIFLKTWVPGWWESKTAKEREDYTKYTERSQEKYNTVNMLCKLINIDMKDLFSIIKCMNRYERLTKWEKCLHISHLIDENVRRFLAISDELEHYYKSTGRRRMYAE